MKIYQWLVVEAIIGFKWPILAISLIKLAFLTSTLDFLQHTLGQISHDIFHGNGSQFWFRGQNWPISASFSYQSHKIYLFYIELAFVTPKIQFSELQHPSNILQDTILMAYCMQMGRRWVLEAKIGLKQPILAITLLKLCISLS